MHSSTARKLVVMLTGGLLLLNAGCGPLNQRAERERSIARIREGKADRLQVRHATSTLWLLRNDRVIDALAEIVAHGEGTPRVQAAAALAYPHEVASKDWPQRGRDARALGDGVLPARVAPVLLAALSGDEPTLRATLLLALGSIDEPTAEVIAAVRTALSDRDPAVAEAATVAVGMVGTRAADAADDLAKMLGVDGAVGKVTVAAALARVSDEPPPRALAVLMQAARGDDAALAALAVAHLRDLGARAEPARDALMAILHEQRIDRPPVAEAIVAISPESLPGVLSLVVDAATSEDRMVAMFADGEIDLLEREHPEDIRAVAPRLAAAVDGRTVNDGVRLADTLRRVNTGRARKAYNDRIYRGRVEAAVNGWEDGP